MGETKTWRSSGKCGEVGGGVEEKISGRGLNSKNRPSHHEYKSLE